MPKHNCDIFNVNVECLISVVTATIDSTLFNKICNPSLFYQFYNLKVRIEQFS